MRTRPRRTWIRRLALGVLGLLLLAALALWLLLRGSLAQTAGSVRSAALTAPVSIARDAGGVPLIGGANRLDIAWATGFVHAQERFFQMDLLRRTAAGELAELFGPRAVPLDRARRLHRFRDRARRALAALTPAERVFVERYVAGVNAGLDALAVRPFEYLLTNTRPVAWRAEDSLLVVWAMYIDLQGNLAPRELARGWLRDHSDPAQLAFLLPQASSWDAPLDAGAAPPPAPLPATPPAWWQQVAPASAPLAALSLATRGDMLGSNNYAIAGSRSASGAAIVADDMHLGLQLPNIWYRLAFVHPDAAGRTRRLVGVTLPGAPPLIIAGSNGDVAWGFTNSYGDYLDLVEVAQASGRPGEVRTPAGWERPVEYRETIAVKGAAAEQLLVRETAFGPLRQVGDKTYALHWVAHEAGAVNLNHLYLEQATTLAQALAAAPSQGIPAQNFVAGDKAGNIGWTVAGRLPRRLAAPGAGQGAGAVAGAAADAAAWAASFPLASDGAVPTYEGLLAPASYPRVVNPASGQLSTANSRQLFGAGAALLGDGGFDLGARSTQLRDRVAALGPRTDVPAAFAVALDDRALFLAAWRTRALAVLDPAALAGNAPRASFRRLLETGWDGHASVDSVGYRLTRNFMWALHDGLFGGVNARLATLDPKASMALANPRWPALLARLLDAQPAAWLPPGETSWRTVQLTAIDRVITDLARDGVPLEQATWGQRNTASFAHPIALAMPQLASWLGVPPDQLAGDAHMPRVAGPRFGQSERMTVSPGHEEAGLYNMPGGQSGHPLSPYFRHGHADWVAGRPQPLLPGPAQQTLTLLPALAPARP